MAASKNSAANLEYWTGFFNRANGSIFDVIENAILVAANDSPQELRSRRDRIVEKIYTVAIPRCFSCIERCNQQLEEAGSVKHERENREKEKEGPEDIGRMVVSGSGGSNCSYDEVEAITEEIERESETVGEVLRIKEILLNQGEEVYADFQFFFCCHVLLFLFTQFFLVGKSCFLDQKLCRQVTMMN
jgi:hypothetical protein